METLGSFLLINNVYKYMNQEKINEDYQKVLNLLDNGHIKLARELLNVTYTRQNGPFSETLYACLTDEQFVYIISDEEDVHVQKHNRAPNFSRNEKFQVYYLIKERKITLRVTSLGGLLTYKMTDTDMNKRKRRFVLDLCL